jgi:hypothetical protein
MLYSFDIGERDDWPSITTAPGLGLGWEFALREAIRQHCKQRGDIGWRDILVVSKIDLPPAGRAGRWLAHVQVQTSRHSEGSPDRLDVWVRRGLADDDVAGDG